MPGRIFSSSKFSYRLLFLCAVVLLPVSAGSAAQQTLSEEAALVESTAAPARKTIYISIIIDDIGNSLHLGRRAINLPGNITYAVLPHRPHGQELAEQANQLAKEIMLHAPMSNINNKPLGLGALTANLKQDEFTEVLRRAIVSIPYLKGVNNHMGSELTEKPIHMAWLMKELHRQQLYFVDSLTTGNSVAWKVAKQQRVPGLSRNIFLDNDADPQAIDRRFKELIEVAKRNVGAVAIGHPYRETLTYLEKVLPVLHEQNIELISISAMLQRRNQSMVNRELPRDESASNDQLVGSE